MVLMAEIPRKPLDRRFEAGTRWIALHPRRVLLACLLLGLVCGYLALQLKLQSDFVKLLPTDSPTAQRFNNALLRRGGAGSTLMVVVESPNADSNRRLVDDLVVALRPLGHTVLDSIDPGPREIRAFARKWFWLFVPLEDLERIDCRLEREIAARNPMYLDLQDTCAPWPELEAEARGRSPPTDEGQRSGSSRSDTIWALDRRISARLAKIDRFPSGYFQDPSASTFVIVLRTRESAMGGRRADQIVAMVQDALDSVPRGRFDPRTRVGLGGDLPNSIAEREALIGDVSTVSALALTAILAVIALFFRSPGALAVIGACVAFGCSVAFAIAQMAFGHLNLATSFLGAIIAGNGINTSIVYLARYRERRRQGRERLEALEDAAVICRRGTWLAALAAAGAYGALMVTSFRGFYEFGLIGATGMLACWVSAFVLCPALIMSTARWRHGSPIPWTGPVREVSPVFARVMRFPPKLVLVLAAALSVLAATRVVSYLRHPWELNFARLTSSSSKITGANYFSSRADKVLGVRGSPILVLADRADQTEDVKRQILALDRNSGKRRVAEVSTLWDQLGGPPHLVQKKLQALADIREHLDTVIAHLEGRELQAARHWRPPDYLRPLHFSDLPALVRMRFQESDGTVGTPVYVQLGKDVSQSQGENLLAVAAMLDQVKLADGRVAPNASRAAIFAEMIRSIARDGPRATLAALLGVVVVTLLVTRSLGGTVVVTVCLLCGVCWTVGWAAWTDLKLNFLNFVALPLTFGIGVEYSINLYDRYLRHGRDMRAALGSAGGAVALCSTTTILGYASLLFADNRALQSFGRYAIAGEVACLLAALAVLPAATSVWSRRFYKKTTQTAPRPVQS